MRLPGDDGPRFAFGRNWTRFARGIDEERVREAERHLRAMLDVDSLAGRSFLDVGCGSGLFSLAARRLGATVTSLDIDPEAVACTAHLRHRYRPDDAGWSVRRASILDDSDLRPLENRFDVVYSWGVLHHTGDLDRALTNVERLVLPDGLLAIALYNDQGVQSRLWGLVKRTYVSGPVGRWLVLATFLPAFALVHAVFDLAHRHSPLHRYREHHRRRGMSVLHDWIDWLGGHPYEPIAAATVLERFRSRGYRLRATRLVRGPGNNEFVFQREAVQSSLRTSTNASAAATPI